MDVRMLAFGDGDPICGWGRLTRSSELDWFDPPMPAPAVGYVNGTPAPTPSSYSTPVDGAHFTSLENRYERDGTVSGFAMVYGVWRDDRIVIGRQTDEHPQRQFPRWSDPPCPPPPGGWPVGTVRHAYPELDPGELTDTGAATSVVIFRPSDEQEVLVIAATDPAAVEARLRPHLGDRLCVVPSRWTKRQLDGATEHLRSHNDRWRLYVWGPGCDETGQARIEIELLRVTSDIADWARTLPDGLVRFDPCLVPERFSVEYLAGTLNS